MSNSNRQKRRNPWKSGTTRTNRRTLNGTVFNSKSIKIWGRGGQFLFSAPWFHQPCCYNLEKTVNCKVGWIIWLRKVLAISFFFCFCNFCNFLSTLCLEHRLRTEAFFHRNPKLLGLGRQFGPIDFGAFGLFLVILVLSVPCPCFPLIKYYFYAKLSLYIQIPNIFWNLDLDLNSGCNESRI